MGTSTIFEQFREWIGGIGWAIFLWGINMTEEQYVDSLYMQELNRRQGEKEK